MTGADHPDQVVTLYMTTPDEEEAQAIVRALLAQRLIACANILPGGRSVFHWDGEVSDVPECYVLLKTCRDHVPALLKRIPQLHSYDTPCIGVWPWSGGFVPFMDWVRAETQ